MMSLNSADALRRKLEDEHDFNAEQANGTLIVVDEMVDHGIDRVLKSIADLESKMNARFDVMDERFNVMDERFKVIKDHLKTIEDWIPVKIGFITIALIAAYAAIFGS
ncbi:MAG: hypothetical protein OXG15_12830 [Gammaproteobacteria bacterium]|nr:hypothetical protein [Gammaproteobacteria bacterium]